MFKKANYFNLLMNELIQILFLNSLNNGYPGKNWANWGWTFSLADFISNFQLIDLFVTNFIPISNTSLVNIILNAFIDSPPVTLLYFVASTF